MSERDQSGTGTRPETAETKPAVKKKRILLVEDDARARYILMDRLNKAGLEAELAPTAELALKKVLEVRVDAVILDLIIPGMKGVDLIKEIRRKQGFAEVPIYVCTSAVRMKAWGKRGSKAGATRIYDKAQTPVEAIVAEVVADLSGEKKATPAPAPAPRQSEDSEELPAVIWKGPAAAASKAAASVPARTSAPTGAKPSQLEDLPKFSFGRSQPSTAKDSTPSPVPPPPIPSASSTSESANSGSKPPIEDDGDTLEPWNAPVTGEAKLPSDPAELTNFARDLQARLHMITCERDALVSLMSNEPIVREPGSGDTAYQTQAERTRQVEQELVSLQQVRDELNAKLSREEAERAESKARSEELERRLAESTGEIERLKSHLDRQLVERSSLEVELGQQLEEAKAVAARAELAFKEEAARSQETLGELETLRRSRDELSAQLAAEQQAAEEARRRSEEREEQLRQSAAEQERIVTDLEKRVAEKGSVESALTKQLQDAKASAEKAQEAYQEEAARGAGFERETARLAAAREEMNRKLAEQEQAASESRNRSQELEQQLAQSASELERAKAELDRHANERGVVESQLREQLQAAQVAAEKVKQEYREETSFFTRSTDELEALRRLRDDLNARLTAEREAAAASHSRSEELEQRLRERGGELEQLKAELERQHTARASLERQLTQQMEASREAIAQAAAAYKQEAVRRRKFEEELTKLRNVPTDGKGKAKGAKVTGASARRLVELESKAQQSEAELERVKGELDKQVAERARLEAEYQSIARGDDSLQQQLARLSADGTMESRVRETISALARVTAELEKSRGERRRLEQRVAFLSSQLQNLHEELRRHLEVEKANQERIAEMEQQLQERDEAVRKAQADLERESADRQVAEAQLRAGGEVSSQLKEQFNLLEEAKAVFKRTQDELEGRLKATEKELAAAKARAQKQTADRQRLQAERDEVERKLQEESRQNGLEIRRLQSTLEVESLERRRLEGQAVQARYSSMDAARLGRAFVNSYRSQLRPPTDSLLSSIHQLLDLSLDEEPKKLIENVLENALLLQTSLRDESLVSEASRTDAGDQAAAA